MRRKGKRKIKEELRKRGERESMAAQKWKNKGKREETRKGGMEEEEVRGNREKEGRKGRGRIKGGTERREGKKGVM